MTPEKKVAALLADHGRGAKTRLAKHLGVSPVYVTRWVEDQYEDYSIPKEYITKIEGFFKKPPGFLLSSGEISPISKVPVAGTADCGAGDINHMQETKAFCYYNGDHYDESLYCVVANGDSMSPLIDDGDEVICDPRTLPVSGDRVHYQYQGESAIKVFVHDEEANIIQFVPVNQSETFKTRTIRLDDENIAELKMSKVVAVNKLQLSNRSAILRMIGR